MYASIRHYQVKPGTSAEVTRKAQEGFVPIISQAPSWVVSKGRPRLVGECKATAYPQISDFMGESVVSSTRRLLSLQD